MSSTLPSKGGTPAPTSSSEAPRPSARDLGTPALEARFLRPRRLALFIFAALSWSLGAEHDAHARENVVTISEVTIVGRIQKPIAAVDVARIQPKLTLGELRQPFLHRITEAVYRAPF